MHLRRFYDILLATGRQPELGREAWCAEMRAGMLQQKIELWPVEGGGEMVGGVMFAGDTVHVAVLPAWHGRWITRRMRRAYDTWTHTIPIRALIDPQNAKAIELATRLGFVFQQVYGPYHLYVKEPTDAA